MQKVKFQLDAPVCKKLFRPLYMTINSNTVLPILESILVSNNGHLQFTATDLENISILKMPSQDKDIFNVCIDGTTIKHVLGNYIEKDILFSGDEYFIKAKSGDFNVKVKSDDAMNFPKIIEVANSKKITFDVKDILPILKTSLTFISNDDLRPAMTGAYIEDKNGKLWIAATDAHRLFWKEITKTPESLAGIKAIIPKKSILIALEMFKEGQITLSFDDNYVKFENESKELISRLIDARFPDYSVVIPTALPITFYLKRRQLIAFLKISENFTNKSTYQMKVIVSNENMRGTGGDADFEIEFDYKIPVLNRNNDFKDFDFAMNLKFLYDLIIQSNEEFIKIDHSGAQTKAFIIDDCMLLMPLMLNQ